MARNSSCKKYWSAVYSPEILGIHVYHKIRGHAGHLRRATMSYFASITGEHRQERSVDDCKLPGSVQSL